MHGKLSIFAYVKGQQEESNRHTKTRSFEIPNIMLANFFIQSYTLVSSFPKIDKGISIESIGYTQGFKYVLIGLESTENDG
jgi:hypothetical protein